ncbi:hypothetical protein DM860_011397 [Cuscuta australis]|uniref:Uncharacterized protein n=1 Tax=Cuscuta australis TaxID=267555 RepID=A0A328DQ90_9ASTE|nr:hypothetical protein DM860_011397 [Cuscuta australis]
MWSAMAFQIPLEGTNLESLPMTGSTTGRVSTSGVGGDGLLDPLIRKVTKTVQSQALDTVPVLTTVPQAPIQPQNLELATNTQHLEGRAAHIGENEDDMMVEEDNSLILATTSPTSEYRPAAFHGGPVPTPRPLGYTLGMWKYQREFFCTKLGLPFTWTP